MVLRGPNNWGDLRALGPLSSASLTFVVQPKTKVPVKTQNTHLSLVEFVEIYALLGGGDQTDPNSAVGGPKRILRTRG